MRKRGKLQPASWDEAFKAIAKAKPGNSIAAIAGDMVDCETMLSYAMNNSPMAPI